jgi:D-alanine-D-alanine ligase
VSTRVLVLAGGRSAEHDVSLASAASVVRAMDPARLHVTRVNIARDGRWTHDGEPVTLAPGVEGAPASLLSLRGGGALPVDVVFPVLHGPFGEDGTVQGLCATLGVPCVGAGVAASAVSMDKALFKAVLHAAGIPSPAWVTVRAADHRRDPAGVVDRVAAHIGYPAFCKPARLGSSVGISPVPGPDELAEALELALSHDDKALVERAVRGREVEVGVLGNDDVVVSPVGEIRYASAWYDYAAKYDPGGMSLEVPAALPADVADEARVLAARAFALVGCRGMARVDFFVEDDSVLVSELNTIPGFTPTSVYARLVEAAGVPYEELVARLVDLALEDARARAGHRA